MLILILLFVIFSIFIFWLFVELTKTITSSLQNILEKLEAIQYEIHMLYEHSGGKQSFEEYEKKKSKEMHEKLHKQYMVNTSNKGKAEKEENLWKIPDKLKQFYPHPKEDDI